MLASSNARKEKPVQMAVDDLRESANCRTSKLQQEALTMQDSAPSIKAERMIHMERTESNYHEDTSVVESGKQDLARGSSNLPQQGRSRFTTMENKLPATKQHQIVRCGNIF